MDQRVSAWTTGVPAPMSAAKRGFLVAQVLMESVTVRASGSGGVFTGTTLPLLAGGNIFDESSNRP
jgi:hypothetical protein